MREQDNFFTCHLLGCPTDESPLAYEAILNIFGSLDFQSCYLIDRDTLNKSRGTIPIICLNGNYNDNSPSTCAFCLYQCFATLCFFPSQILNEERQNFEDLSGSQSSCISDEVSYMRAVAFTFCVRFTVILDTDNFEQQQP